MTCRRREGHVQDGPAAHEAPARQRSSGEARGAASGVPEAPGADEGFGPHESYEANEPSSDEIDDLDGAVDEPGLDASPPLLREQDE